jgi:hypothetical protein
MFTTAGDVMDMSAALLNDASMQVYTYAAQLPYLKMALLELREDYEINDMPVTKQTSAVVTVPASTTTIGFTTIPALPADLIEINQLWERQAGVDPFIPVTRRDFLPHYLGGVEISQFLVWSWFNNEIKLLPANRANDLKMDYVQELFNTVVDETSPINVNNAQSFLHYKTAALCARYIGENESRAADLNQQAIDAQDRAIGIATKTRQSIATRRRPFRASFKRRGTW